MNRRTDSIPIEKKRPADRIASRAAFGGMLFALALVLQWAESLLPPLPVPAASRVKPMPSTRATGTSSESGL